MSAYICENCGNEFHRSAAAMKRSNHAFCSSPCCGSWMAAHKYGTAHKLYSRISVPCAHCGEPVERPPHKIIRSKNFFCSIECRGKYHSQKLIGPENPTYSRIPVNCAGCGAIIQAVPFRVKNYTNHFCNMTCLGIWRSQNTVGEKHPNWKGGYKEYYGPNWNRQRRAARQRDNYRCQHCKRTERKLGRELDVHHVVPFRTFGYVQGENERYKEANRLENLISLCPSCHQYAERGALSVQLKLF